MRLLLHPPEPTPPKVAAAAALLCPSTFNLIKSSPFAEKNGFVEGNVSLTQYGGGGGSFFQVPV